MDILKAASRASRRGEPARFSGSVWIDEIATTPAPARLRAYRVSFDPGARTAWHTHPFGQVLHVLAGIGRVQRTGGPVEEIGPGDTVWIAPGEMHWHGAAPGRAFVHLAMQEATEDGAEAEWFGQVEDE